MQDWSCELDILLSMSLYGLCGHQKFLCFLTVLQVLDCIVFSVSQLYVCVVDIVVFLSILLVSCSTCPCWLVGVLLISLGLCSDAVIGNYQEKIMKTYGCTNTEMVFFSYGIGFFIILAFEVFSGQFFPAFTFCLGVSSMTLLLRLLAT